MSQIPGRNGWGRRGWEIRSAENAGTTSAHASPATLQLSWSASVWRLPYQATSGFGRPKRLDTCRYRNIMAGWLGLEANYDNVEDLLRSLLDPRGTVSG